MSFFVYFFKECSYRFGHEGAIRVIDDGGEGAVVVEKHDDLLPFGRHGDLVEHVQRRGVPQLPTILKKKIKHLFLCRNKFTYVCGLQSKSCERRRGAAL